MGKPNKQVKLPLLILGVLVILTGGGFAVWSVLKKEEETPGQSVSTEERPPVRGRANVSGLYSEEELAHSALAGKVTEENSPQYTAVWSGSSEGKRLILDRMKQIQLNIDDNNKVRAKHKVGRTLVDTSTFSSTAIREINKMFSQLEGVVENDFLTYPIYGKFEKEGVALRRDLNNFLSKDGQGYNLSEFRHGGNAWWLGSVGLNLMYGNQSSHLHSADKIWWYKADRNGLDFFKRVNGHDVPDRRLLEKQHGKGIFAAWGVYTLAKKWLDEMDYFDEVTRTEAIKALEQEGKIVLLKPKS